MVQRVEHLLCMPDDLRADRENQLCCPLTYTCAVAYAHAHTHAHVWKEVTTAASYGERSETRLEWAEEVV